MRGYRRRVVAGALAALVVRVGTVRGEGAPRFIEPLEEPSAVAVGAEGSIYVCETLGHRVSVFDRSGVLLRRWGHFGKGPAEFDGPGGISVTSDGRVYVADTGNDRIEVFGADGRFERQWGRRGTDAGEFDAPLGLAVSADRVFVADTGNDRVQVFLRDGTFLFYVWSYGFHDGAFDRPVDVAVDGDGSFYVSDQGNSRIQKFTPDGRFALAWGGRGRRGGLLIEPRGLDLRASRLLVADPFTHRLVAFDPTGALLGEWSTGGEDGTRGIDAPSAIASFPTADGLVVCSAVEDRCQIVAGIPELAPATEADPPRIAREGYTLGGAGEAMVVTSRETGVPFVVDLSRRSPAVVATLGGPGREHGEFIRPAGFELDSGGETILVSDGGNARLQRLRLGPARATFLQGIDLDDQERLDVEPAGWTLVPATVEPGPMVRDARGRLVLLDTAGRRVIVLDDTFRLVGSWGGPGEEDGKFAHAVGLALDPGSGAVYVLDAGRRRVQEFDLDGRLLRAWGGPGRGPGEFLAPSGIATGSDGSVYVVDRGADRVQRFDRRGKLLATWGSTGALPGKLRKSEAVHVDGRGRVVVIDSGNSRAEAFTPRGRFLWEMPLDPKSLPPRQALAAQRPTPEPVPREHSGSCGTSVLSNAGRYTVCATSVPEPIPLNRPFAMSVQIFDRGTPARLARNVILDIDATMPEHHHGMSLKPQVRAVDGPAAQDILPGHGAMGDGRFEIRGMLFHMPGRWEIHFDITHGAITERAQLEIDLD